MLYEVKNGTISLSGNEILSHFNFRMVDGEKIGIVGRNGAGKTTLLKLINGDVDLDYNDDNTIGEIIKSKETNIGYLKQQLAGDRETSVIKNEDITAYAYLLEAFKNLIDLEARIEKMTSELSENYDEKKAIDLNVLVDTYNYNGGNTYIKQLKTGFSKFGFTEEDLEKKMKEFSGGQTTKISLLKLLLSKPDVLILDEPTNHLDIGAIEWMENYLKNYTKNIVVVSHDRMFLDNICNVIYDIENKIATRYDGNYSDFTVQKEINYQLKLAEYNKNVKEIERLTALADRFRYKATKAKMVQSKDKVIEKLSEKTIKPLEADTKNFHVRIIPNKAGGKEVLRCENLSIGYSEEITRVSFVVNRKDRLAIIGSNGTGKSTFIKTIVGKMPKISGDYQYGHEIEYEYFDQRIAENTSTKTLFEDFSDEFPTYTNTEIRNRLGRFLFGEEDIGKKVCNLSGGEKVRLCLAKIFEKRPNLLILDEPTNHLDILGKESLEKIIDSYEGTVILVSHDRYFVKKVSNKILYFEEIKSKNTSSSRKKSITHFFEFGYEDYEKYIESINDNDYSNSTNNTKNENSVNSSKSKADYNDNKKKNKGEKKARKIEEEISKIEKSIKEIEEKMNLESIKSNFEELVSLQNQLDEMNKNLENKYSEWDELNNI